MAAGTKGFARAGPFDTILRTFVDEFDIDQSIARNDAIVAKGISAITAVVGRGTGADHCIDCGHPIPAKRRRAAPFSERCVDCQHLFEHP